MHAERPAEGCCGSLREEPIRGRVISLREESDLPPDLFVFVPRTIGSLTCRNPYFVRSFARRAIAFWVPSQEAHARRRPLTLDHSTSLYPPAQRTQRSLARAFQPIRQPASIASMAGNRETVASSTPNGAVALPKRPQRDDGESSAPVWSLDSTATTAAEVPLCESA